MKLIARKNEYFLLKEIKGSNQAEFVAIYGRRRVGKTFLVRSVLENEKNCFYFECTGQKDASLKDQIDNFCNQLDILFKLPAKTERPNGWSEVFRLLNQLLSGRKEKKFILFFDELPWFATQKSHFIQSLDYIWNQTWSKNPKIKLITCGSAATWMNENLIQATGGLHNRLTRQILVEPFKIKEVKEYLSYKKVRLNDFEILKLYMTLGGIPYYWSLIPKGKSSAEIVELLFFKKDGALRNEFHILFKSLFDDYEIYEKIVSTLMSSKTGLDRDTLLKAVGLKSGGTANKHLQNLEHSGFIEGYLPFGNKKKNTFYRLIDEFCYFALYWKGNGSGFSGFWTTEQGSPRLNTWSGYAFENFCLHHKEEIAAVLKIHQLLTRVSSWRHLPSKGTKASGAQIDLIFERKDGCLTFVELKCSNTEFSIDKSYAKNLENKKEVFKTATKFKGQIFTVLVSPHGVKDGLWSDEVIDSSVDLKMLITI